MSYLRGNAGTRGEANAGAVLTTADVLAIRVAVAAGEPQIAVAARVGISRSRVSQIVRGVAWPHVGGPIRRTTITYETTPTP